MKSFIFILILLSTLPAFSQTKYLIYFKDKNIKPGETLNKNLPAYTTAMNNLSERAVQRRIKTLGGADIITYEDLPIRNDYKEQLKAAGIQIIRELTWFNAVSAYLDTEKYTYVSKLPFVNKIETVKSLRSGFDELEIAVFKAAADNLNYGNSFTQLDLSDIPQVHKKGFTGQGVLIGVIDSGFDWRNHESLYTRNVIAEYDFIFDDNNTANEPGDVPGQHNHGTTVFSILGGFKDSILVGASFSSSFLLAKTEDTGSEKRIEEDNYAAALMWMENQGVDVTSSSVGYNVFEDYAYTYNDMNGSTAIVTQAVNIAFEKGVVTVNSAGNEGNQLWKYIIAPADAPNIIAVGSVTSGNNVSPSSSRGPTSDGRIKPEVVAMGVSVWAAAASGFNSYSSYGGTSMAAPIASGAAALLLSAHPHLNNRQVRSIILETAGNSTSPDNNRGYGLISAARAAAFPNLEYFADGTVIHKIFIGSSGVNPSSVRLHYARGNEDFIENSMSYNDTVFTFRMPVIPQGSNISFYFTYNDTTGENKREPEQNNYQYREGDLIVSLNLSSVPTDYVLSQNYPNPFNGTTKIDFIAAANEKAEMVLIDAAGQKVKILYNGVASAGINTVIWDGRSDRGYQCASGVYYYILKIGGKEYGKKLIFLK